jgi:hypothetical protein
MLCYRNDRPEPQILYPNQLKVATRLGSNCGTGLSMASVHRSPFASLLANREQPSPMGQELAGQGSSLREDR